VTKLIEPLTEIRSIAEISRILRQDSVPRRLLFRGQSVDRPLLPRIARTAEAKHIPYQDLNDIERRMLKRLKRESPPVLNGLTPSTDWEWLSIAQHQGLPTRLLDWTANALAGLWFAVAVDPKEEGDGVLWVLDVQQDNEKSPTKSDDVFSSPRTFVFQPFHIDRRIAAQSAWFTAHRYAESKEKFIPLEKHGRFKEWLTKYTIPAGKFITLRKELRAMGVTQAALFPDLSGLCAEIQADYLGSWRPPRAI
jgi:hypothetical protein